MVGKKKKKVAKRSSSATHTDASLIKSLIARDEILVDNFVGLQKALVNMSIKFNELTDRMDKLLEIYQKAADVFVQKQIREADTRVDLNKKATNIMQQNKVIAQRQVMMQGQKPQSPPPMPRPPMTQAPAPHLPQAPSPGIIPQAPSDVDFSTKPKPLPRI